MGVEPILKNEKNINVDNLSLPPIISTKVALLRYILGVLTLRTVIYQIHERNFLRRRDDVKIYEQSGPRIGGSPQNLFGLISPL